MECLIQYLDEIEDLFDALALLAEKIRRAVLAVLIACLLAVVPACGVLLALHAPPLGLATVFVATAVLLYRAAIVQPPRSLVG
jgi:uncharacterized membrane protein